jgi:hypothetical protein
VSLVAARRMLVDRCVLRSAGSRFVDQENKGEHREHLISPKGPLRHLVGTKRPCTSHLID